MFTTGIMLVLLSNFFFFFFCQVWKTGDQIQILVNQLTSYVKDYKP